MQWINLNPFEDDQRLTKNLSLDDKSTGLPLLEILTWLMFELPFAVRVEDGTPVSADVL